MSELENRTSVDQLLAARPDLFARHGSVSPSWRRRGGKMFGPYYRLRYRDGGRCRSIYLGRAGPLVDRVRQTLHVLQVPFRQCQALAQLRRRIRDALRADRRVIDAHLRHLGLRLKGFEVRGWRRSPITALLRLAGNARRLFALPRIRPFRLPRLRQLRLTLKSRAAKRLRDNWQRIAQPHRPDPEIAHRIRAIMNPT